MFVNLLVYKTRIQGNNYGWSFTNCYCGFLGLIACAADEPVVKCSSQR